MNQNQTSPEVAMPTSKSPVDREIEDLSRNDTHLEDQLNILKDKLTRYLGADFPPEDRPDYADGDESNLVSDLGAINRRLSNRNIQLGELIERLIV